MGSYVVRCCLFALAGILAAAGSTSPLAAQQREVRDFVSSPRFGIGYSGAMPEAIAGARVWYLTGPRRFGVFADVKGTVPQFTSHANYCPQRLGDCTMARARSLPDQHHLRDENQWLILNGGVMYALSREFAFMLGAGAARREIIAEWVDDTDAVANRITVEGNYFVPHDAGQEVVAQAVVGLLLRAGNRLAFSFGHETGPKGMTIGLYLMLP